MLQGVSSQELAGKNTIAQAEQINPNAKKNPYADVDKNLLIDETNISNEAFTLYQKDLDIKKFTKLALSDPDDTSHNVLVADKVFNARDDRFDDKVVEDIFNNRMFLKDLLG